MVLEKTLESPLDYKEIQPVHSKGDWCWVFFGRNDAKAETLVLWPPHTKSWLIGKDCGAGRDWGQVEKGTTEDEMAGWYHRLNGREFEWTLGVSDGQGGLACWNSWGRKESDTTELLNWTELKHDNQLLCNHIGKLGFKDRMILPTNIIFTKMLLIDKQKPISGVCINWNVIVAIYLLSCIWLFSYPIDCSPPGLSVHGISQARILEWVAISFSRASSLTQGSKSDLLHCRWILRHQATHGILLLFSHLVVSNSLQPHELQHARLPCPSLSPGICSNSCPLSQWCHPTIFPSIRYSVTAAQKV